MLQLHVLIEGAFGAVGLDADLYRTAVVPFDFIGGPSVTLLRVVHDVDHLLGPHEAPRRQHWEVARRPDGLFVILALDIVILLPEVKTFDPLSHFLALNQQLLNLRLHHHIRNRQMTELLIVVEAGVAGRDCIRL